MECFACNNEMKEVDGCTGERKIVDINGVEHDPIRFGDEYTFEVTDHDRPTGTDKCHDCGIVGSSIHHPGCDVEECPMCGGQYFICDCWTKEKEIIWS